MLKTSILNYKNKLLDKGYNLFTLRKDLLSAISVALLALPQSLAYALIVGLPPQTGIIAAIFGTLFTSSFGNSRHLISGPTNATALLIQAGTSQIMFSHFSHLPPDLQPAVAMQVISQIVLFIGAIQILVSILKLGGLTQFISRSVMIGYVIGVALSIVIGQTYNLLAIEKPTAILPLVQQIGYLIRNLRYLNPLSTLLGFSSLIMLIMIKKINKNWPRALLMLLSAASIAWVIDHYISISSPWKIKMVLCPQFELKNLMGIHIQYFNKSLVQDLLFISSAIALLSIVEINSITRLISAKSGQPINSNRDILGTGFGNLASSFFLGTLPSSGSLSRSTFNYQSGARTRLSGVFSAIFILALVLVMLPLIQFIPIASLAALLMILAFEIIDFKLLKMCLRATKRDTSVLLVTVSSCLFLQLDIALFIGITLSLILYLRVAANAEILEYVFTQRGKLRPICPKHGRNENRIRILNIEGNLFFGSIDSLHKKINSILKDQDVQTIILRFYNVHYLDASTCYFLELLAHDLKKKNKNLYLSEMLKPTASVIYGSNLLKDLGEHFLYESDVNSPIKATKRAFEHALERLNSN